MPIEMHVNFSNFLTFPISVIECHSGAQPPHTYTPIHTQASGLNTKLSSCKALGHTNFQLRLIFHIKICITHTRKRQEIIKMHLCSAYTYIDTSMVQYIFIYVYAMCMTHFPFMISENYRKSIIFGNINKKIPKQAHIWNLQQIQQIAYQHTLIHKQMLGSICGSLGGMPCVHAWHSSNLFYGTVIKMFLRILLKVQVQSNHINTFGAILIFIGI